MRRIIQLVNGGPKHDMGAGLKHLPYFRISESDKCSIDVPLGRKYLSKPLWRSF